MRPPQGPERVETGKWCRLSEGKYDDESAMMFLALS